MQRLALNDVGVLRGLLSAARTVLAMPHNAVMFQAEVAEAARDVAVALRVPAPRPRVGRAEQILACALAEIALTPISTVDQLRLLDIAARTVPIVEDHLFRAVTEQDFAA